MKESTAFKRLIEWMPKDWLVLDVGCGGLDGENTSDFLVEHFKDGKITGICKDKKQADRYKELHPEIDMRVEEFFSSPIFGEFNLLVLDLNIEGNLRNWSFSGLDEIKKFLKKGSYVINYVMMTDQYGDPETPQKIRNHSESFWGTPTPTPEAVGKRLSQLPGFSLVASHQEERRPYIHWILLRYE